MQKSWRPAEDVSDTSPRERALKSVTFQELVSVISDGPAAMELESQQVGEVVQVRGLTHMFRFLLDFLHQRILSLKDFTFLCFSH